ncbi:MAG: AlpA family transcriptional regulator [Dehalococcoidia bacterium]|nr:AlpA family transcriptional regulator [Dehalococcoidia bacterium]
MILMTVRQVQKVTGLSRTTIYRLMDLEEFPRPVKISASGRAVRWIESEIEEWIASRPRAEGVTAQ